MASRVSQNLFLNIASSTGVEANPAERSLDDLTSRVFEIAIGSQEGFSTPQSAGRELPNSAPLVVRTEGSHAASPQNEGNGEEGNPAAEVILNPPEGFTTPPRNQRRLTVPGAPVRPGSRSLNTSVPQPLVLAFGAEVPDSPRARVFYDFWFAQLNPLPHPNENLNRDADGDVIMEL